MYAPLPRILPQSVVHARFLAAVAVLLSALMLQQRPPATIPSPARTPALVPVTAKQPLAFVPDSGGSGTPVRFQAHGLGGTLFFTPQEVVLSLPSLGEGRAAQPADLRLGWQGASPSPELVVGSPLPGVVNDLTGKDPSMWRMNVPTYEGITYHDLYPGVDLAYVGQDGRLKGTYTVAAGADPARIRWHYQGASAVRVDAGGNLVVEVGQGAGARTVTEQAPVAWQDAGGRRLPVHARYTLMPDGTVGFALGAYDHARPLTIDPVISWSTYLGGGADDQGKAVAVDAAGDIFVAGMTLSTAFPGAMNTHSADYDAFVTKVSPFGTLVWSTYLGGTGYEEGDGVAVDASGNVVVVGRTASADFPTRYALQSMFGGGMGDAFATKLTTQGGIMWSTYLGGTGSDGANAVAVDGTGNILVAGSAFSPNFPASPLRAAAGSSEAFVVKLAPDEHVLWSTNLGGSGAESARGVAVDRSGNVALTGFTTSTNFPTLSAFQGVYGGGSMGDAFVTKLSSAGSILWSSYLGGTNLDEGNGIAIDAGGNVAVTGRTSSVDFPIAYAFQTWYGGSANGDAFVTKVSASGGLLWSTYLGGSDKDGGKAVTFDQSNNVLITGYTASTNFPTANALQPTIGGGGFGDAIVTKLSAGGQRVWSTYLGGNCSDEGNGIVVDGSGNIVVAGATASPNFPTRNALQPAAGSYSSSADAFVIKLGDRRTYIPLVLR